MKQGAAEQYGWIVSWEWRADRGSWISGEHFFPVTQEKEARVLLADIKGMRDGFEQRRAKVTKAMRPGSAAGVGKARSK